MNEGFQFRIPNPIVKFKAVCIKFPYKVRQSENAIIFLDAWTEKPDDRDFKLVIGKSGEWWYFGAECKIWNGQSNVNAACWMLI